MNIMKIAGFVIIGLIGIFFLLPALTNALSGSSGSVAGGLGSSGQGGGGSASSGLLDSTPGSNAPGTSSFTEASSSSGSTFGKLVPWGESYAASKSPTLDTMTNKWESGYALVVPWVDSSASKQWEPGYGGNGKETSSSLITPVATGSQSLQQSQDNLQNRYNIGAVSSITGVGSGKETSNTIISTPITPLATKAYGSNVVAQAYGGSSSSKSTGGMGTTSKAPTVTSTPSSPSPLATGGGLKTYAKKV